MTHDAKNIAVGVFLALVAFRLFEMILHSFTGGMDPVMLLVIVAVVAVALVAASKSGRVKLRR